MPLIPRSKTPFFTSPGVRRALEEYGHPTFGRRLHDAVAPQLADDAVKTGAHAARLSVAAASRSLTEDELAWLAALDGPGALAGRRYYAMVELARIAVLIPVTATFQAPVTALQLIADITGTKVNVNDFARLLVALNVVERALNVSPSALALRSLLLNAVEEGVRDPELGSREDEIRAVAPDVFQLWRTTRDVVDNGALLAAMGDATRRWEDERGVVLNALRGGSLAALIDTAVPRYCLGILLASGSRDNVASLLRAAALRARVSGAIAVMRFAGLTGETRARVAWGPTVVRSAYHGIVAQTASPAQVLSGGAYFNHGPAPAELKHTIGLKFGVPAPGGLVYRQKPHAPSEWESPYPRYAMYL